MVMADGFAWNGQTYDSLSKVAFAITGTKWNGVLCVGPIEHGTAHVLFVWSDRLAVNGMFQPMFGTYA